MVKGRRKRAPTSGSGYSKNSAFNGTLNSVVSPMRKESKLDGTVKVHNQKSPDIARGRTRLEKSPIRITSFFRAQEQQENGILEVKTLRTKQNTELLGETEHYNGGNIKVEEPVDDHSEINELFKTDETPVAVPCRNPPTPHRINMPNVQPDDTDIKETIDEVEKKSPLVHSPILRIVKKPAGRGRGKLKYNSNIGPCTVDSTLESKTNHKVSEYFPVRRSVRKSKKTVLEEKQRDLENKVVCQVEDGLEVRHFVGKGRGVVTTRTFNKGEFVIEYIGDLVDQVTAKKREAIYAQDQNTGCYMYYFQHRGQQYCVDATAETEKLGRLVNHSRNGNLIARVVDVASVPHLVLTAKEDIPIGVEVTYDYGDRSREAIRNHPWLAL
ncbi:histone-lysine N-methyltransferase PR-Set7 [Venturia canescens]|uniref:histone-lysine N-methyltransferase PR-Set7 n=1 Tax=Venturia canescens TaxID=32260 RepID=UPI001C9BC7AC|nr:histone-lysine N-methyltransferase PR-Set7 [Venturia canescens]